MGDTITFAELVEFVKTTGSVWVSFDGVQLKILQKVHVVEGENPELKFDRIGYVYNFILSEEDVKVIYGSNKLYTVHHKKGFMIHVWYEDVSTMYLP